jgi:hypothetical protein
MPLLLTKAPGQKLCLAIESLAMAGGGPAKIRRAGGAGGRGKDGEVTRSSPRVGLRLETGRGWHWRVGSAAQELGGRWGSAPANRRARPGQQASGES